jgi:thioredoxin-like negative regulator of GroEL
VKVGKVNIHENMDLAQEYQVYSIPRVLLFNKSNKPSKQLMGLVSQQQIAQLVNSVVTATA